MSKKPRKLTDVLTSEQTEQATPVIVPDRGFNQYINENTDEYIQAYCELHNVTIDEDGKFVPRAEQKEGKSNETK